MTLRGTAWLIPGAVPVCECVYDSRAVLRRFQPIQLDNDVHRSHDPAPGVCTCSTPYPPSRNTRITTAIPYMHEKSTMTLQHGLMIPRLFTSRISSQKHTPQINNPTQVEFKSMNYLSNPPPPDCLLLTPPGVRSLAKLRGPDPEEPDFDAARFSLQFLFLFCYASRVAECYLFASFVAWGFGKKRGRGKERWCCTTSRPPPSCDLSHAMQCAFAVFSAREATVHGNLDLGVETTLGVGMPASAASGTGKRACITSNMASYDTTSGVHGTTKRS